MAKHTPGPWEVEYSPSGSWTVRHEWEGAIVYVTDQPVPEMRDPEKLEANARLIAAAPELLAALNEFAVEYVVGSDPILDDTLEKARAAIIKAETR